MLDGDAYMPRVTDAPPRPPRALPVLLTRLIGRERELAAVRQRLLGPHVRLLTLVGPPGIGKTRLGLAVADQLSVEASAGVGPASIADVFFVPLAPLREVGLVASAIAHSLGIGETGRQPVVDSVKATLRERPSLLVLDNFEHLPSAASVVAELLAGCPRLKILATSRAPLHLYGEHEFPVPPLVVPDLERSTTIQALAEVPAVALFVERAQAIRPDFVLTAQNAPTVAKVCVRLDGLPLALELGAARIKLLPPQAILARLGSRLDLLSGSEQDRSARHQTLRAAIDWSYDLLSAEEQSLFRRLAVFAGGWTLDAAEAVCGIDVSSETSPPTPDAATSTLKGLAALVDQSLVQETEQSGGEPRYSLLETIREYGLERLRASGEESDVCRRHAEYYLALAEQAEIGLHGAEQLSWAARLEAEHDNLRKALRWSQVTGGESERGLRLASALGGFWEVRGHLTEGRRWLETGLAQAERASPEVRAKAMAGTGMLAYRQGDLGRSRELLEAAAAESWALGDRQGLAFALTILSRVNTNRGEFSTARAQAEEGLALARESGDRQIIAVTLYSLGGHQLHLGENAAARASFEAALALDRELGDSHHSALVLAYASLAALRQGDRVTARALQEESLAIKRAVGDSRGVASSLMYLADVASEERDYGEARARLQESLAIFTSVGDHWTLVEALGRCARLEAEEGKVDRAARLFAASQALREGMGGAVRSAERPDHERGEAAVRARLGPERFASEWAHGWSMTVEQAVQYARSSESLGALDAEQPDRGPPGSHPVPRRDGLGLTPREREVAALVARGLTDPQIAATLAIGTRTVETHVANCRGKLALATRAELAAWAVRHGVAAAPE